MTAPKQMAAEQYPEHEKMRSLRPKIDVVTDFLEWVRAEGMVVAETDEDYTGSYTYGVKYPKGIEELLAAHFGIDLKKIDREKADMLTAIRKVQGIEP